ncbi:MAG: hypothetical protein K1X68_08355 [Saprospiraceae bacterium]|nr:hypothetical protein [Saprospiraceae bacterium]MBX7176769.1 hypothetical protein [Saprospiraceae bacterium]HMW39461.1 hypothetical protein [Saprospiraceae bacterium]HMX88308.1 hypothetical protein [Saprospiraceae bacterium]HMZ40408.1 hypothetical protein [Saprospiraceae bacterium]
MIIVHETFICKPGNASKVAKLFQEVMSDMPEFMHVMTDLTGEFNKVIIQSKYENLTDYEQRFEMYMQNTEEVKKMKEKMQGYQDLYLTGSREIYRVW